MTGPSSEEARSVHVLPQREEGEGSLSSQDIQAVTRRIEVTTTEKVSLPHFFRKSPKTSAALLWTLLRRTADDLAALVQEEPDLDRVIQDAPRLRDRARTAITDVAISQALAKVLSEPVRSSVPASGDPPAMPDPSQGDPPAPDARKAPRLPRIPTWIAVELVRIPDRKDPLWQGFCEEFEIQDLGERAWAPWAHAHLQDETHLVLINGNPAAALRRGPEEDLPLHMKAREVREAQSSLRRSLSLATGRIRTTPEDSPERQRLSQETEALQAKLENLDAHGHAALAQIRKESP